MSDRNTAAAFNQNFIQTSAPAIAPALSNVADSASIVVKRLTEILGHLRGIADRLAGPISQPTGQQLDIPPQPGFVPQLNQIISECHSLLSAIDTQVERIQTSI